MIDPQEIVANWGDGTLRKKIFAQLDQTYTYEQLQQAVSRSAQFLRAQKLQTGDRLIISSRQPYPIAVLFWACLHEGTTAVLLDPDIGPSRAHELIALTDCKALIVDEAVDERWQLAQLSIPIFKVGTPIRKKSKLLSKMLGKNNPPPETETAPSFWQTIVNYPYEHPALRPASAEDIAYILFTSGSTAIPKAVQISYRALWSNLHTLQKVYELKEDSRIFNILTVYHTDGIIQGPILSGFVGGAWYHPFTFAIDRLPLLFDSFYKYQISHFITVPTILRLMYDFGEDFVDCFDYPEFQNAITSAAPFELDLWEAFEQRFATRVVNNYGLTETVAGASYCGPQEDAFRRGSIGIPIDCAFKIVDTNGQPLPYGEEGELLIKGDNLLTSYLNNPAATSAAFTDGWFRTGDTAVQDAEGFYYLRGRIKNLIISGGINIQPEEVNAVLNSHPAVMEAACVGLPDNVFGELPVAAVVLKAGATVTTATLVEHCRQELEENKIPRTIHLLAELPKTGSGKIKYSALKELLLEADPATRPALPFEHNLREAILAAAKSAFKLNVDNVNFAEASTLTVDGWDSLAHLAFITQLEENLNLRFSAKEIMQISSLLDTETILQKKTRP